MVFGTFVLVHLAAPAVAGIAPQGEALDLSTKSMASFVEQSKAIH